MLGIRRVSALVPLDGLLRDVEVLTSGNCGLSGGYGLRFTRAQQRRGLPSSVLR